MNAEQARLQENNAREQHWHCWGPYLADRAWGTVREDYSANGDAWNYLPHDHARSRAYRWNEDGIGGISDFKNRLCFAFAFWNERDPFLKERLFGVTGPQGNHGEDVKEVYWYTDNTPSHSFMRMTYRYPQSAFPYEQLINGNAARSKTEGEFELWDTGVLAENRFFDIDIEYAKAGPHAILIQATATNRAREPAVLHLLPRFGFGIRGAGDAPLESQICKGARRPRIRSTSSKRRITPSAPINCTAPARIRCSSPKMRAIWKGFGACPTAHPTSKTQSTTRSFPTRSSW
jgi:hypothetical protein